MEKLYKETGDGLLYWETWDKSGRAGIIHWGKVGEEGQSREISSGIFSSFKKEVQKEYDQKIIEGYTEVADELLERLVIEYKVDEIESENDLTKRHNLESRMNEFLGWRGLGHCDGGSIGGGTMEVLCFVVNFDLAKNLIEEDLKDTGLSDYSRIFKEE
ncbi:MAG TPA: hypothetical protein VGE18_02705 [Candidatus Paceibacterota bacterium]